MSNEKYFERVLYNKRMSVDWLNLLEDASDFNHLDLKSITALLSAPCDLGTVIIRENEHSFSGSPMEALRIFYSSHPFFDYSVTQRCFKLIEGFPSYKVPFVSWHYILCPLESPENGAWLNPLEVYEEEMIQGKCYAELINGLVLELPFQKRSFLNQAEKALYSLCYLRREYMITTRTSGNPLSYIELANTPFLQTLSQQPLLQSWFTDRGDFHQHYFSQVLMDHQNPSKSKLINSV